jgi:hypothetical protein
MSNTNVELIGQNWNQLLIELNEWQRFGKDIEAERAETINAL